MLCPELSHQVIWLRRLADSGHAGKLSVHHDCGKISDRAQVLYFLYCVVALVGVHHGTGQHMTDLTARDFSTAMKVSFSP